MAESSSSSSPRKKLKLVEHIIINDAKDIKKIRTEKRFSDVTIWVGKESFKLHKLVLAASSEYFRTTFTEEKDIVTIKDVTVEAFRLCVDYIYFEPLHVTEDKVEELLQAADYLGIKSLMQKCAEELEKKLGVSNCIKTYELSQRYNLKRLKTVAKGLLMEEGNAILSGSVSEISFDTFKMMLFPDELNLSNESVAFNALVKWIEVDEENRKRYFCELLNCIRLPIVDKKFLKEEISANKHIKSECNTCKDYLRNTNLYLDDGGTHNLEKHQLRARIGMPDIILLNSKNGRLRKVKVNIWENKLGETVDSRIKYDDSCTNLVYYRNSLYLFGYEETFLFSNPNKKEKLEPLPRMHGIGVCTACLEDEIFVIGGKNLHDSISIVDSFNVKTKAWRKLPDLENKRCCASAVAMNGNVYVIGGKSTDELKSVEMYDNEKWTAKPDEKWTAKPDLNTQRHNHVSTFFNGKIFVAGGVHRHENIPSVEIYKTLASVETYKEGDTAWTSIAYLNVSRQTPDMFVYHGRLFIFGGKGENKSLYEEYIEEENMWKESENSKGRVEYKFILCHNSFYSARELSSGE